MSGDLRFALDSLTAEVHGTPGRTGRLELNTGSITPAVLGPVDALELATVLARWATEEIAHRRLTRVPYVGARYHFPPAIGASGAVAAVPCSGAGASIPADSVAQARTVGPTASERSEVSTTNSVSAGRPRLTSITRPRRA